MIIFYSLTRNTMTTEISQAISNSIQKKEINSTIINSIRNDMNKWYSALKKTISGGWNKKKHSPWTKSHEILSKNQITSQGEKWWQQRSEKRSDRV